MDEEKRAGRDLPLVSIVIPAYNHASFVEEAIRSALEQTYPRIELLVFDDGSTDGTRKVIERVHRETGKTFRFVAKSNEGLVPTLNRGLRAAQRDTGHGVARSRFRPRVHGGSSHRRRRQCH